MEKEGDNPKATPSEDRTKTPHIVDANEKYRGLGFGFVGGVRIPKRQDEQVPLDED